MFDGGVPPEAEPRPATPHGRTVIAMNDGRTFAEILGGLDVSRKPEIRRGQPRLAITDEVVGGLEREFGYRLPADYRAFLIEFGGLTIDNVPLPTARKSLRAYGANADRARLHFDNLFLYGLYAPDPAGHLHSQDLRWRLAALRSELPDGYFPIGQHVQDRTVCICCRDDGYGSIYLHYAEDAPVVAEDPACLDGDGTVRPEALCVRLAPSFTDFLGSLRSATEDEVSEHSRMLDALLDDD